MSGAVTVDMADGTVLAGNHFDSTLTLNLAQGVLVGNWVSGAVAVDDDGAEDEVTLVGNSFDGAVSIDPDDCILVGNHFDSTLVIEATADDTTVVGNKYLAANYTDSGTNTLNANNNTS
jgi:hypothetical protein